MCETDCPTESQPERGTSHLREDAPRADVEASLYLLDGAPHFADASEQLTETVGDLLTLLANAYALEIFCHLHRENRPLRFSEFETTLGISPKVLSRRLTEFGDSGLVSRRSYDENPPRVEYKLTTKAEALGPSIQFFYAWVTRYGSECALERDDTCTCAKQPSDE